MKSSVRLNVSGPEKLLLIVQDQMYPDGWVSQKLYGIFFLNENVLNEKMS